MIIEIRETVYKGFRINHAEAEGWEIILEGERIWFPHLTAAQGAVDVFYNEVIGRFTDGKNGKRRKRV